MRGMFKALLAGLVFAAVAGLLAVGAGIAAKPKVASKVTLKTAVKGEMFVFRGRVQSRKAACRRNRKVRITAGHLSGAKPPFHEEGTVRTNRKGRFKLEVPAKMNSIGAYRARAQRKAKRKFVCKPANSQVIPFRAG